MLIFKTEKKNPRINWILVFVLPSKESIALKWSLSVVQIISMTADPIMLKIEIYVFIGTQTHETVW